MDNRILVRKFGPKRDAEKAPSNIVRVIKSRILRWLGHVVRMEKDGSAFKILTGKPTGSNATLCVITVQLTTLYCSVYVLLAHILILWYHHLNVRGN